MLPPGGWNYCDFHPQERTQKTVFRGILKKLELISTTIEYTIAVFVVIKTIPHNENPQNPPVSAATVQPPPPRGHLSKTIIL